MKNLTAKKITGGCLCGAIRYDAEAFLEITYYCHCRSCQKGSGQPAAIGVLVKAGTLTYSEREPTYYNLSDSGQWGFCSNCSTGVVWRSQDPEEEWATNITVGTLDHPEQARPYIHMFVDEKVPWYVAQADLPQTTSDEAEAIEEQWKTAIGWNTSKS